MRRFHKLQVGGFLGPTLRSATYRRDIDGLRAISVAAVVLYHAGATGFGGGYIGVDIFFVISGFVITGLILREEAQEKFSFIGFYERRIRRLLPTALVIFVTTTLFAWTIFTPAELEDYCKSLFSTSILAANWFFLRDVSYFSTTSDQKLLLHTWSLSIEEQFYIVFPTLLLTLRRFRLVGIIVLTLTSLLYAEHLWANELVDRAFYDSFARFWELLIGCLTALLMQYWQPDGSLSSAMRLIGLVAIVGSVTLLRGAGDVGQVMLTIPVFGAALVLAAVPNEQSLAYRAVASVPLVWFGLISYATYMWHWPILAFARIYFGDLPPVVILACVATTIVLSAVTYYAIEKPIRRRAVLSARGGGFVLLGIGATLLLPVGALGVVTKGYPGRLPAEYAAALKSQNNVDARLKDCLEPADYQTTLVAKARSGDLCVLGDQSKTTIDFIVWGDSHAYAMAPAFDDAGRRVGKRGLMAAYTACAPLRNTRFNKPGNKTTCPDFNEAVLDLIQRNQISIVYMVSRWGFYVLDGLPGSADRNDKAWLRFADNSSRQSDAKIVFREALTDTLSALSHRRVVIVQDVPEQRVDVPSTIVSSAMLRRDPERLWMTRKEYLARNKFIREVLSSQGREVLDPASVLCVTPICTVQRDGAALYLDDDHLSIAGARLLEPIIAPTMIDRTVEQRNAGPSDD